MSADDWPEVRVNYEQGIATGNATFETEVPTWQVWDGDHLTCCRLVAADGTRVLGWLALSPVSRRQAYAGVAEISVYVANKSVDGGSASPSWWRRLTEPDKLAYGRYRPPSWPTTEPVWHC